MELQRLHYAFATMFDARQLKNMLAYVLIWIFLADRSNNTFLLDCILTVRGAFT